MKRLTKILIATTALLTLPASLAFADGSNDSGGTSNILNGQVDFHISQSTLNLSNTNIAGNVSGASVAGGNAVDITTMNNTNVDNNQFVTSVNIGSTVNADVTNVGGTVDLQSQAVCNSASISMDPTSTNVNSTQQCNANDPSSALTANLTNIGNDVSLSGAALGNTFEEDTNAPFGSVANAQINRSNINSTVNASALNINGNLTASSAAIGNNAQIIHYATGN